MTKYLWLLTMLGSLVGALVLLVGVMTARGAPETVAAAATGMALAVIPYCLARAFSEISTKPAG